MFPKAARGRRLVAVGAAGLVGLFAVVLLTSPSGAFGMRVIDDVGEGLAAGLGAAGCLWRARRCRGRWRLSWVLIGAGLTCWAGGELVWSYYELGGRRSLPFPSLADLGYLMFPVLALSGLLVYPSAALQGRGRFRVMLDGAMVAGSLFNLTWATSLGTVYHEGGQSRFAFLVSLAYPASDLVLITVAVSVLAHARSRSGLPLAVLGLSAIAVADSGFSYLTTLGVYHTGSVVDIGWFAGFLLLGVAAVASEVEEEAGAAQVESPVFLTLPYVLVLLGGVAEVITVANGRAATLTLIVQGGTMSSLLLRQLLTVLDNRRLALDVIAQQVELRFRAFHDVLTGLANRALFYDRVAHALELQQRDKRPVSVLFCDLDDFKAVNDSLGHQAGDALLVTVAERLNRVMRSGDTVARLGGDEFAVLLENEADVSALSSRILSALGEPVELTGRLIAVRASIGTASADPSSGATSSQDLLRQADVAMYAAKQAGKGMAVPFTTHLALHATADLDERIALREDIGAGMLQAAFQPIVRRDGSQFAFEALARWQHRSADVAPERFIELAERGGLLADLDMLVTRRALAHAATFAPEDEVLVSVNFGRPALHEADLPDRLLELLAVAGISRHRLIVEVPETLAIEDLGMIDVLARLRDAGFSIAVDDFGVGYSNLGRLGQLAPHIIKLDKSLIGPIGTTPAATRIVAGMIDLAHDLGALVIAEGIETDRQRDVLGELGCDALQGFLIGRPVVPHGQTLLAHDAAA